MTNYFKSAIRAAGLRIEELILFAIVILNVLDFFEILSADLDYTKKIISWTALGYLLYTASPTKIFFGKRHRKMDSALIFAYFSLIIKNFVAYSSAAIHEAPEELSLLYRLIVQYAAELEQFFFYVGGTALFLLAMYAAYRYDILIPSLMHVIHEEGPRPKTAGKFALRFLIILLVYVFFFVVVFNLMMEWLAIAVDAPLLMLGLFFYLFKAKDFGTETLLYKLGNMGEEFYLKFINLFHQKTRIFLGIAGMLVLHLVTDVGNFVIPYLVGFHDILYFSQFGPGHDALPQLFLKDVASSALSIRQAYVLLSVYALNAIAILMLLTAPAFLWYVLFRERPIVVPRFILALFASSVTAFILTPAFKIKSLANPSLVGVDIQTLSPLTSQMPLLHSLAAALFVGLLVYILSANRLLKRFYVFTELFVSMAFFSLYIYFYFVDTSNYYIRNIIFLLSHQKWFVALFLFLMFGVIILFYLGGLVLFFYEMVKK
ncbi:hypothetical protein D6764_00655 [Candidatus Woesearchaeota archaeon]|nr:MAG: hypothetical protein D6764_00655 [Candidatus Woesearchaeota archaeon]